MALVTFRELSPDTQKRILQKLQMLKNHPDVFSVVGKLHDIYPATHKLRIGNYRLILELKDNTKSDTLFHILRAGHRKDIYRLLK